MNRYKISGNTSIYVYFKNQFLKLLQLIDFRKISSAFVQNSLLATIFAYFIGTILLLFRSWNENIPFVPLNIIQTILIDIYFLAAVVLFLVNEYWICEIWHLIRISNRTVFEKIFGRILSIIIASLLTAIFAYIISLFTKNLFATLCLFGVIFLLLPGYFHVTISMLSPKAAIIIECGSIFFIACLLVYNIPLSLGGLAPQSIEYCVDGTFCQTYDYFGNYNEMLILKCDGIVVLEPIGRGVIKYAR